MYLNITVLFSFLARNIQLRLMFYINRVKIANSGPKGHTHQHNLSSEVLLTLIFPCKPGPLKYTTHLTQSPKHQEKKKKNIYCLWKIIIIWQSKGSECILDNTCQEIPMTATVPFAVWNTNQKYQHRPKDTFPIWFIRFLAPWLSSDKLVFQAQ